MLKSLENVQGSDNLCALRADGTSARILISMPLQHLEKHISYIAVTIKEHVKVLILGILILCCWFSLLLLCDYNFLSSFFKCFHS